MSYGYPVPLYVLTTSPALAAAAAVGVPWRVIKSGIRIADSITAAKV